MMSAMAKTKTTAAADFFDQALKALAERCPFDCEELASRVRALPFRVARHSNGRRKYKQSSSAHGEQAPEARSQVKKQPKKSNLWDSMEVYFRPITVADVESLRPRDVLDSCLSIPMPESSLELVKKEEERSEKDEEQQPMDIDSVGDFGTAETTALPIQELKEEEEEEDNDDNEGSSMNWVVGSKHRALLTTQRPTKKRKLLGSEAGLDQLLVFPHSEEVSALCDVCCLGECEEKSNKIVSCCSCGALVHKKCYGLHRAVDVHWMCSWCKHLEGMPDEKRREQQSLRPCLLCPKEGGALKPVNEDQKNDLEKKFAHLFCSLWMPEVYVEDTRSMEPVVNIGGVPESRTKLVCNVCKVKHGVCVRCSTGTCRAAFHPICAREGRHQMEIWGKFGCDNVELRAFCSKHSIAQDVGSARRTRIITRAVGDDFSIAKPPPATVISNKLPKLILTCKNKEKNMTQYKEKNSEVAQNDASAEQNALCMNLSSEDGDMKSSSKVDTGVLGSNHSLPDNPTLILLVKKLIGRGKFTIGDMASAVDISSDSLEAALMGEISSFPSELRLKIVKWVQGSAYMPTGMQHLKFRNASGISSFAARIDCPNTADASGLDIPESVKVAGPGNADASIKLTSSHKRTNNSTCILKKDKLIEDASTLGTSGPWVLPPEAEGNLVTAEKDELSKKPESTTECALSKNLNNGQADEINIPQDDAVKKKRIVGSCSGSYVHPYIQRRLVEVQKGVLFVQETKKYKANGHGEDRSLSANASESFHHHSLSPVCTNMDQIMDPRQRQLAKAKGVLKFSPEDEVEGEILYLQNKLLENSFSSKHSYDDLLRRVAKRLPQELDALKKEQWDSVLVNQFLREAREAKKQGRKERRRQETKTLLAADVSVSSRNPLLRKDGNDECDSTHQSPRNVCGQSGRSAGHPPSVPRLKETPSSAKVSPDKHSGALQFADISKENPLSCDICRRAETLVNRIFICSSCKVAVHLDCYWKFKDPIGPWKCELCEEKSRCGSPRNQTFENRDRSCLETECSLCGGSDGAFRKASNGQWVHAFCAEWLLESIFRRGQQTLVDGMDVISKARDVLTCCICQKNFGVCSKCGYGNCQVTFHPSCARAAGFYMNVKTIGGSFHHKAYCEKHSVEQRQKNPQADSQRYGAEELKGIRQIRFELEKVRLLCERIVKREKVKRELVLISHDILASRRDYVAYSAFRSSFYPPGVSSESASTTFDNKSYSRTVQRSEGITVDTTLSGKHSIRFSFGRDRKTNDSSTSRPSFKWKISDRTSYSGKQLPHRTQSASFLNSIGDGEKRFKARKPTENFHSGGDDFPPGINAEPMAS